LILGMARDSGAQLLGGVVPTDKETTDGSDIGGLSRAVSTRTQQVAAYWRELRGDRPFPAWSDVDLLAIYDLARNVSVVDVEGTGASARFRYRFVGTALVDYRTSLEFPDPTGRWFDAVEHHVSTDLIVESYRNVVATQVPRLLGASRNLTERHRASERAILPLGPGGDAVDKLMVCVQRLAHDDDL